MGCHCSNSMKGLFYREILYFKRDIVYIILKFAILLIVFMPLIFILPKSIKTLHESQINYSYQVDPHKTFSNFYHPPHDISIDTLCPIVKNESKSNISYIAIICADNEILANFIYLYSKIDNLPELKTFYSMNDFLNFSLRPYVNHSNINTIPELCGGAIAINRTGHEKYIYSIYMDQISVPLPMFTDIDSYLKIQDLAFFNRSFIVGLMQVLADNALLMKASAKNKTQIKVGYIFAPMMPKEYKFKNTFNMEFLITFFLLIGIELFEMYNYYNRLQKYENFQMKKYLRSLGVGICVQIFVSITGEIFFNMMTIVAKVLILKLVLLQESNIILIIFLVLLNYGTYTFPLHIVGSLFGFNKGTFRLFVLFFVIEILIVYTLNTSFITFLSTYFIGILFPYFSAAAFIYQIIIFDQNDLTDIAQLLKFINNFHTLIGICSIFAFKLIWYLLAVAAEKYRIYSEDVGPKRNNRLRLPTNEGKNAINTSLMGSFSYDNPYQAEGFEHLDPEKENLATQEKCVSLKNIYKSFPDGTEALKCVDLEIYEGEIFSLLGHNGAGKSTTLSILTKILEPTSGYVSYYGKNISTIKNYPQLIGICIQENAYYDFFTLDNFLHFISLLKGINYNFSDPYLMNILTELNISNLKNVLLSKLSYEEIRKIMIASSLIGNPQLLILDEPTSEIDPISKNVVWDVIKKRQNKMITILTTQNMYEADYLGNRIAIMSSGNIVCCGSSLFLKSKYGLGYHLSIFKDINAPSKPIETLILSKISNANIKSSVGTEIICELPFVKSFDFESLFTELEQSRESLKVTNYNLQLTTLEDVFLKIKKKCKPKDLKHKKRSLSILREENRLPSCFTNIGYFTLSTFRENFRHPHFLILNLFYPFLLYIICFYVVQSFLNNNNNNILNFSENSFNDNQYVAINKNYYKSNKSTSDILHLNQSLYSVVYENRTFDLSQNPEYNLFLFENDTYNLYNSDLYKGSSNYGNYLFVDNFSNSFSAVAYGNLTFSLSPYHYSWLLSNSLLSNYGYNIEEIKFFYMDSFHTFSYVQIEMTQIYGYSIIFVIIFLYIGFRNTSKLIEEAKLGIKHLIKLKGLSTLIYWIGYFIFDYFTILLLLIGISIFQIISNNRLNNQLFIFFGFPASLIPFNYFLSVIFGNCPFFYDIFQIILMIYTLIFCPFLSLNKIFYQDQFSIYKFIILNLTPYSSLISLFLNYYVSKNANYQNCENPKDFECMGQYEIGLLCNFIFYSILLIIAELITYCKNYRTSKTQNEIMDEREAVYINHLKKSFDGIPIIKNVNISVNFGEIFALLGLGGSGRSTIFNILTKQIFPDEGTIRICGHDLYSENNIYGTIGYCPQRNFLYENLTIKENLYIAGKLQGLSQEKVRTVISQFIQDMELDDGNRIARHLSGGNKHKLAFLCSIIGNHPILLLDQPTSSLDPRSRRQVLKTILKYCRKFNSGVILSTNDIDEAETICSKLGILHQGELKCCGNVNEIKETFASSYNVSIKVFDPDLSEVSEVSNKSQVSPDKLITLIDVMDLMKSMNALDAFKEIKLNGIGGYLHNDMKYGGKIKAYEAIRYGLYYLKRAYIFSNFSKTIGPIEKIHETVTNISLKIESKPYALAKVFGLCEKLKKENAISEYLVNRVTLSDIFQKFTSDKN